VNQFTERDEVQDDEDRRLSALLAAPHADANPAVWARVRTRLAPVPRKARSFDGLLEWLGRPAALAAATAALVVALGTGWSVMGSVVDDPSGRVAGGETFASTEAMSLVESLLEGAAATELEAAPAEADGEFAPRDSGGRS
jgi:hypothetical protein